MTTPLSGVKLEACITATGLTGFIPGTAIDFSGGIPVGTFLPLNNTTDQTVDIVEAGNAFLHVTNSGAGTGHLSVDGSLWFGFATGGATYGRLQGTFTGGREFTYPDLTGSMMVLDNAASRWTPPAGVGIVTFDIPRAGAEGTLSVTNSDTGVGFIECDGWIRGGPFTVLDLAGFAATAPIGVSTFCSNARCIVNVDTVTGAFILEGAAAGTGAMVTLNNARNWVLNGTTTVAVA